MRHLLIFLFILSPMSFADNIDNPKTTLGPVPSHNGLYHGEGLTTEEFNTSPNPAPVTESELIENSVLRYGQEDLIQAEEAEEMEAEEMEAEEKNNPSFEPNPNKIGN